MDCPRREATIEELLRDPVARLLMESDGVDEETIRRLLEELGERLQRENEALAH